jgi:MFS family permease
MGILASMAGAGQIIAPLIGGSLTEHASWRWCFWINIPVGAVTVAAMLFIQFPSYKQKKAAWTFKDVMHDFDITGFVLFAPACIMLLLALEWGGTEHAWSSATIIGLFCGTFGTFTLFGAWEYRQGDSAMIPPSLVSKRVVASAMLTAFFQFGSLLIQAYYMPLWFQVVKNASPTMSAVYTLPTFIVQIVSTVLGGILTARLRYLAPLSVAGGAFTTIAAGLFSTLKPKTGPAKWIGYQVISGFGRGLAIQLPLQAAQTTVGPDMIPTVTATVAWAQTFGGSIMIGLAQTTLLNLLRHSLWRYAPNIPVDDVITEGATGYIAMLRERGDLVGTTQVTTAYNDAVTKVFYLCAGCGAAGTLSALGIGRTMIAKKDKKIKKSTKGDPESSAVVKNKVRKEDE